LRFGNNLAEDMGNSLTYTKQKASFSLGDWEAGGDSSNCGGAREARIPFLHGGPSFWLNTKGVLVRSNPPRVPDGGSWG